MTFIGNYEALAGSHHLNHLLTKALLASEENFEIVEIADEKVGPKGVKIRCKRCDNIIIVRPQESPLEQEQAEEEQAFDAQNTGEETLMRDDPLAQARKELAASSTAETAMVDSPYQDDEEQNGDEPGGLDDEFDDKLDDPHDEFSGMGDSAGFDEDQDEDSGQNLLAAADDFSDDKTSVPGVEGDDDELLAEGTGFPEDPFADIDSDSPIDDRTMADFRSPGRIKEAFEQAEQEDPDDEDFSASLDAGDDSADDSGDDFSSGLDAVDEPDEEAPAAEFADDLPGEAAEERFEPMATNEDGDLLDNELSGAFDNAFGDGGGSADDPFAQVASQAAEDEDDKSRQATQFYSQGEMARVEDERNIADRGDGDAGPLDDLDAQMAPQFEGFAGLAEDDAQDDAAQEKAPALADEQLWYVAIDDEQVGPESEAELAERWKKRQIDADSLVWQSGMADWLPLRDVDELKLLVAQQTARPQGPPQTEIERPGGLADFAPLADPFAAPAENSDPFAAVADGASLQNPAEGDAGWRPHGMTEIYQAASLAESSAMQPAPSLAADESAEDDEVVDWQPGAAAALASLVEDEISTASASPFADEEQISSADDSDLIAPKLKAPDDALVSGPDLGLPAGLATPISSDPFSQQLEENSDDINLAQLAGQSSMVMQRPSYVSKPKRELPWALILGAGGGGLAVIGLFTVVIILLLREPKAQVVVQQAAPAAAAAPVQAAPAPAATSGTKAAPQPVAAAPAAPANAAGQAAAQQKSAPVQLAKADVVRKNNKKSRRGKKSSRKKHESTRSRVEPKAEPKPEPKPEPKKHRSGNCDPILYPDGNCPTGNAAMAAAKHSSKKKKLSKIDILKVVKRNIKDVRRCAAAQKKRNPRLARGTIKMSWFIRPDGRTKNVRIATSKFKGTYVGDCIQKSVKRWRFASFDGDAQGPINFPFPLD